MTSMTAAQRMLRNPMRIVAALLLLTLLLPEPLAAQASVHIVGNDRGGIVGNRAAEIRRLKSAGKRVEIRGRICLSSCTMYLGAGDVCVNPNTQFGFHGPSYYGRPLAPQYFEYWSDVIADHYPAPVREWFMTKARYKQTGYYTLLGAELIRLGVKSC
jgi:hypothetical protein